MVSAATRTPFEATRRVFVLERVDTMNDEVANRLLKTLEEPASFVHLILLTESLGRVLDTVVSRCQLVRFDPLPAARIAAALEAEGVPAERALACARPVARQRHAGALPRLRGGQELRAEVERASWRPRCGGRRARSPGAPCSSGPSARRAVAEERAAEEREQRLELEPKGRERRALEREMEEAAKRDGRRARTAVLDLALTLTELAFRDLVCVAEGAPEAVLAVDSPPDLAGEARGRDAAPAARGRRALRGDAPVAGAERDRGAGALGARLPAGRADGQGRPRAVTAPARGRPRGRPRARSPRSCGSGSAGRAPGGGACRDAPCSCPRRRGSWRGG